MARENYDIVRLEKVINLLKEIENVMHHMDVYEYDRFRKYIYSRMKVDFPVQNPTQEEVISKK